MKDCGGVVRVTSWIVGALMGRYPPMKRWERQRRREESGCYIIHSRDC